VSTTACLPHLGIQLDGETLEQDAITALEEVRIQQRLSQPTLCEVTFSLTRETTRELRNIAAGSQLSLTDPSHTHPLFDGEITAVEYAYGPAHEQTVRVRSYDKLHRLRKRQPVRVHVQVTPLNLARDMVADLGLAVKADSAGPEISRVFQFRQSDLDLLIETTRRFGLYLTLRGDVLHLIGLGGLGDDVELELGKNLFEAKVELNGDPACRSVLARGWDASRVESHEGRASHPGIGRKVEAEAPPDKFGIPGVRTLAGEVIQDDRHADAIAQAELDLRAAREVTLWAVAEGNPDLMPGTAVHISGIARQLAGRYVITSANHLVNRRTGYVSEISTAPPSLENKAPSTLAAWGTVTRVDDPEKLGRIRVSLPGVGNVESDWMGVVAAGAGSGKGFVVMPAVGDQVLVLFISGEASQGVVLGGLYGMHGPGDYGIDGTAVRRYTLGTPCGQKICLDDNGESIRLENKDGSFLEISPKKSVLHSVVDLEIEAPGRSVVIKGKTIDFRQA